MSDGRRLVRLFLCGDVMTGRGVDQILSTPSDPRLHEPWVRSAEEYLKGAEKVSGPIPRGVDPEYVWGDALEVLEREGPRVGIGNLETAVTTSDRPAPKGIHYRMHPDNVDVLAAVPVHCWGLANNHVLDWGEEGLLATLRTLEEAGLRWAGAGRNLDEARAPAVIDLGEGGGRVLVFALAGPDCGVPPEWAAGPDRPGVRFLPELSGAEARRVADEVAAVKRPGDVAVVSVHWGGNWGYDMPGAHRRFARKLMEDGAADVVHGHSSHHPRGIEVHQGRPILYGCGDFLNDYEGIGGREKYRGDLVLMYLLDLDPSAGYLAGLRMVPFQLQGLRLVRPSSRDRAWLRERMDRECGRFGGGVVEEGEGFALDG